jgi:hypothetical protein
MLDNCPHNPCPFFFPEMARKRMAVASVNIEQPHDFIDSNCTLRMLAGIQYGPLIRIIGLELSPDEPSHIRLVKHRAHPGHSLAATCFFSRQYPTDTVRRQSIEIRSEAHDQEAEPLIRRHRIFEMASQAHSKLVFSSSQSITDRAYASEAETSRPIQRSSS